MYYTYLYRDEFGTPIYVGKGKSNRAWYHLKRKDKHPFVQKLQKMIREGHNPQPEFLCTESEEEFALFVEEEAILHFGRVDLGTGPLLNLAGGGEGVRNLSKEVREKMGSRLVGVPRPHTEEWNAKIGASQKGIPKSDEHKEALRKPKTITQQRRQQLAEQCSQRFNTEENRQKVKQAKLKWSTERMADFKKKQSDRMKRVWSERKEDIKNVG